MALFPHGFTRSSYLDDPYRDLEFWNMRLPAYWRNAGDSLTMGNTTADIVNDDQKFGVSIDVSQFRPDELKVNLDGHILTIEGSHEQQDKHNFIQRSFTRKWTLPEDVDLNAVRSSISDKGHMTIEAPKAAVSTGRSIPIERK